MPCYIKIKCPHCKSDEVIKAGFTAQGKQRDQCRHKTVWICLMTLANTLS